MNGIDPQTWLDDVIIRISDLPVSRLPELPLWRRKSKDDSSAEAVL
jgi:hypothetical protein